MIDWQPIETIPTDSSRVFVWVVGKMHAGLRFGSAYALSGGKFIARPEGCNGDWTKDITHWAKIPDGGPTT